MSAEVFRLKLGKNVFFPGEKVQGNLEIVNRSKIENRGIRITLTGKGHSYFTTGSGKNRQTHVHTQLYASCKKTVWGSVFKTPVMDEAGENVVFGPPWAPDEGVSHIPLENDQHEIIVRLMDYDWGKKDDLLGEVCLDVRNYVGKGKQTVPLTRNGRVEKGEITFSMSLEDNNVTHNGSTHTGSKTLRFQTFTALGLRKADWVGKNDVYIQAYVPPKPVQAGHALPEPNTSMSLPAGNMNIPFEFQLPEDLPSSMIVPAGYGRNYIVYSIYANIDIGFMRDIKTRVFFTVMQPTASATMMKAVTRTADREMYPRFCCCPCYFLSSLGHIKVDASTDRTAYAPGETITLNVNLGCEPAETKDRVTKIDVRLYQEVTLYADGRYHRYGYHIGQALSVDKDHANNIRFTVPSTPPTYMGGLGQNTTWFGEVSRYGGRWARRNIDPVVWNYYLEVVTSVSVPGFLSLEDMKVTQYLPVVISGMGLKVLPPFEDTAYWEAQEKLHAPKPEYSSSTPVATGGDVSASEAAGGALPTIIGWRNVPQVVNALPALRASTTAPTLVNGVVVSEPEEDYNTPENQLVYAPVYYISSA